MVGVGFQGWNGKRMLVIVLVTTSNVSGFSCHQVSTRSLLGSTCGRFSQHLTVSSCPRPRILAAKDEDEREEDIFSWDPESGEDPIIIRGSDADEIDGSLWEDIETGQPPKWLVMKELLGVNVFTYILAALIVFFLSMNYFAGPGWLGSMVGVPGTGSFSETSQSFPDTIDLSSPEFRL